MVYGKKEKDTIVHSVAGEYNSEDDSDPEDLAAGIDNVHV